MLVLVMHLMSQLYNSTLSDNWGMGLFAYKFDEKCSEDTEQINKQSWLNVAVIIYMKIEACYDHSTKINLFWLSQTIHLMGSQSAAMAFITTVRSRGVKVRLPLNLKNMREVHGVSTCEVPAYAACQVCVCTPTCMCTSA